MCSTPENLSSQMCLSIFDYDKRNYKTLLEKNNPTDEERIRRTELRTELKNLNGTLSQRIKNEFEELEARRK